MVYRIKGEELKDWVKNQANPGDAAYYYDNMLEQSYIYNYKGPDENPYWHLVLKDTLYNYLVDKYLEEVNKLKIEEPKMSKKCENCKHLAFVSGLSYCKHEDQAGTWVPKFTCCDKHAPKDEKPAPFDNLKFFIKNTATGEVGVKYICEDCGKVMEKPAYWCIRLPMGSSKQNSRPGYYYYCEECDKKKDGKI